ncbi:MAG: iron-containing alcohol dehydrogenase family protein [Chloroflexota bacterium]
MSEARLADRTFELVLRDRTVFGVGAVDQLGRLVVATGGSRAFVVTDPGVAASGVADQVRTVLEAAGLATEVWTGVERDPASATVSRGVAALARSGIREAVVVGVGGGSSIDTAKAVALAAANPDVAVARLGYHEPTVADGLPVVAVPTTAGTGAETNTYGVIVNEATGRKDYIGHPSLMPRATVLDPSLTVGLPPSVTAATGVDALTHSLESLVSRKGNPFAEGLALQVIRTICRWLPVAVNDGSDVEARSQLLFAAHLAGLGQASGTGVGLVHALGHALGTRGGVAHGTALATVLPEVLACYLDRGAAERELALAAVALGAAGPDEPWAAAAAAGIGRLRAFLGSIGQRETLTALGVGPDLLETIAADAMADPAIENSPVLASRADVAAILARVRG